MNWFTSLTDAVGRIENWRLDYSHSRPHSSLEDLAPGEFAQKALKKTEKRKLGELSARNGQ